MHEQLALPRRAAGHPALFAEDARGLRIAGLRWVGVVPLLQHHLGPPRPRVQRGGEVLGVGRAAAVGAGANAAVDHEAAAAEAHPDAVLREDRGPVADLRPAGLPLARLGRGQMGSAPTGPLRK